MKSASQLGRLQEVVLHHDHDLRGTPWWSEALAIPGFRSRLIEPDVLLAEVDDVGQELVAIYRQLEQPAAKANMMRAAILWSEGGVYLDLDTLTLRSFDALRAEGDFFCGEEPIAYPARVLHSRNPLRWGSALAKDGLRDLMRRLPDGWRTFRQLEGLYPKAVNNAVVGCPAGHPFAKRLLTAMTEVPVGRRRVRYELGTTLLQTQVAGWRAEGLRVYPPEYFFPLGPEISEHWFRTTSKPRTREAVSEHTLVVHWYASVRTKDIVPKIDPEWIGRRAEVELFSALVREFGLLSDRGSEHDA